MSNGAPFVTRRQFVRRLSALGLTLTITPSISRLGAANAPDLPKSVVAHPGPWAFHLPKGGIILVSDQQLRDLQNPDQEVDLSLSAQPQRTTLRQLCQQQRAAGGRTVILAFDEFWSQYRPGQGGKPRTLTPDLDDYIACVAKISETLKAHGLGLELSLLSPLEIGPGYAKKTGESGRWVQYVEGWRDPRTGRFTVPVWEHRHWTNNKGTIALIRTGVQAFAFRESRLAATHFYHVNPSEIVALKEPLELEAADPEEARPRLRRLLVRGAGETHLAKLDRVLVVVSYQTPEMDYFSPAALPFLQDLVTRYHQAGIPLNGLYADEMHIQQDWGYNSHHDAGQFTLRFLTPHFARKFAERYGAEFADFEKYLVYFAYGQHGFLSTLDARLPAQHVLGADADGVHRTALLRRRYYDLLEQTVVDLFAQAKAHAEKLYGHELESRAHATWAQSPTIDFWEHGQTRHAPRQYEYTSNFLWSNTVHQAASACSDYFRWNAFLTGGGNDHAEGGWSDRNYYGLALACSTGILNRTPNAYAAAWGMPGAVQRRHQALECAFGCAATPPFMALQDAAHRDIDVLMLYPISLVACEERFGSWMVQYGYANYVTPEMLLRHGRILDGGRVQMAGRVFTTICSLFEPLPPAGLLEFLSDFAERGGRVIWSGPPPHFDLGGQSLRTSWEKLCGVKGPTGVEGLIAAGQEIGFEGPLQSVPKQTILTDFLVDRIYPVEAAEGVAVVARSAGAVLGTHRRIASGGSVTFLGFRPRDDQAASLGVEVRTWYEILHAVGAYTKSRPDLSRNDHPAVVSRETPWLATTFPNGAIVVAVHYRNHVESWPGGFHRKPEEDDALLKQNPLPSDRLNLDGLRVAGHEIGYQGTLIVGFRLDASQHLIGFCGHDCARIRLNGREHSFADQPLAQIAWAPVEGARRVDGGALLELWVDGSAQVQIPLAKVPAEARLYFAGGTPGAIGAPIEASIENGLLKFKSDAAWPQKHLYLVG